MIKKIILTLIILTATGCSSNNIKPNKSVLGVLFDSNPRGASIICGGRSVGYTPSVRTFTYTEEEKSKGRGFIPACSLKWASGATANIRKTDISSTNYGLSFSASNKGYTKGLKAVVQRPNHSGYEKDALFALKLEGVRAQVRQANAARNQANAAQRSASYAAQANTIQRNAIQQQNQQQFYDRFYKDMERNQRNNNYNMSTWGSGAGNKGWKPLRY